MRSVAISCAVLWAATAHAHPVSMSYVDLRLSNEGIDASVEVQDVDLAHDLSGVSEKALLSSDSVLAHKSEIAALVTSRLLLSVGGSLLPVAFVGIAPVADQKSVRLRLRYDWHQPPTKIGIDCRLFPYHAVHQTLLDVYEQQALKREMVFDANSTHQEYVLGSRQSVGSVFKEFLIQGIDHIFTGPDHILFIVGLMMLGGSLMQLLKIVTAFTLAHSVTLCLAALKILSPPARVIEPTIALSIVFVGVHGVLTLCRRPGQKPLPDARLLFAFGFGFIHGFGFANALQELELPRQALAAALFSFNLGVECGQACIVLAVAPFLALLRERTPRVARVVTIAGSAVVIVMGALWFVQRVVAG